MASSPARIAANRRNALKSTGPRTEAGKDSSRRNSVKHGLTGEGIALPGEAEGAVAALFEALVEDLAPGTDSAALVLARELAIASVRSERSFRADTARAAVRVRAAAEAHDEDRRTEADRLLREVGMNPATHYRRLVAMPEGVDRLIARLGDLRRVASEATTEEWAAWHGTSLDLAHGRSPGDRPFSRVEALTRAVVPDMIHLEPHERDDLHPVERRAWALGELVALIDAEVARLEAHRAALDLAGIARDRAEAGERALIDLGPEGDLLRKYEAANDRTFFRSLGELRARRRDLAPTPPDDRDPGAGPAAPRPVPGPARLPEPAAPASVASEPVAATIVPARLGSFFPAAPAPPATAEVIAVSAARTPTAPASTPAPTRRSSRPRLDRTSPRPRA